MLKALELPKLSTKKKKKFEGVLGELESEGGFRGQSFMGYLGLALVFAWDSALRGKFNFCFAMVVC